MAAAAGDGGAVEFGVAAEDWGELAAVAGDGGAAEDGGADAAAGEKAVTGEAAAEILDSVAAAAGIRWGFGLGELVGVLD